MGNSELTWWPVEAGFEIARDGDVLLCRDQERSPLPERSELAAQVLRTRRYPAWVLVNRPAEADVAVTADAELAAARAMKDQDLALEAEHIARRLPVAHQPLFLEQAARVLVQRGDRKRAATLFARAREVETEAGMAVDDEAWLAAHREFAAFGALNTRATAAFVKGLKARAEPDIAVRTLTRVAVLRALAGQAPWPQLPKQLSAFAKAAGRDEIEVHQQLLEQLAGAKPALQESAAAMWTAWRPILVRVCARSAAVRKLLLELLPQPESLDGWWLELLAECGATAGLVGAADGTGPRDPVADHDIAADQEAVAPDGSRAQWLSRRLHHPHLNSVLRRRSRVREPAPRQLAELVVRMAPALRADGEPVRLDGPDYWTKLVDVRVLEACLAHGVPVAGLAADAQPDLNLWWRTRLPDEDLPAMAADPRFAPIVQRWAAREDAARLWTVPALRQFLTPPAAADSAPHPLDGPRIDGAVHMFGNDIGGHPFAPKRLLSTIRMLSEALRAGRSDDAEDHAKHLGDSRTLVGRLEWVVLRAIAPSTTEERRELLTAFLDVWSESVFADADVLRLITAADLEKEFPGIPEYAPGWATAERLRSLVALIREHGAVPRDPGAATLLAERGGLSRYAADLALVGLIGVTTFNPPLMAPEHRKALNLSAKQLEDGRSELSEIKEEERLTLLAGVLPDDPAELWRPGGMAGVAERLAGNWAARFGHRPAVPEATVAGAPDFGLTVKAQEICLMIADPAASPLLSDDIDSWLVPGGRNGAAWYRSSGDEHRAARFADRLLPLAQAVPWAYAGLPAGDPVRAGVPETLRLLRQRLAHPGLILYSDGSIDSDVTSDELAARFGPSPYTGPVPLEDTTFDDGLTIVAIRDWHRRLYFRPAFIGLDERTAKLEETAGGFLPATVRFLIGPVCDRIVARIEAGGLPTGSYEADPRASVPDVVSQVAEQLRLDTDAAALYLQLLAVPHPTDDRVRTWNRWRPAQHKAAVSALLAAGLVIEDKRPKAGRTVFLPGPWSDAGFPGARPTENWKTDLFESFGLGPDNPWPRVLWPDLFAAARDRVAGGGLPA